MNTKDVILVAMIGAAGVGAFMSIRANKEIKRGVERADSVATVAKARHDSTEAQSRARADSIKFWSDSAKKAGKAASETTARIKVVREEGPADTTSASRLAYYINLADTLQPKLIFQLRHDVLAQANEISYLTQDRDDWMRSANAAYDDIRYLQKNTHVVADAAKRKVDLGFLTVPTDVLIGVGSAALGFGAGYLSGQGGH